MKTPVFQRITESDVAPLGDPGRKILQTLGELPDQFARALGRGLTLRENLRCQLHELEFVLPPNVVTLANGWTGSVSFTRDSSGYVVLSGTVSGGTGAIFTLPPGFRPPASLTFPVQGVAQDWVLIPSPMSNGWTNFGGSELPAAYKRDAFGFMRFRGVVKGGTLGGVVFFAMPVGFRPPGNQFFTLANPVADPAPPATAYVLANGDIQLHQAVAATTNGAIDLSGISYETQGPSNITIGTDGNVSASGGTSVSLTGIRFLPVGVPEPWASGVHFASTLPKIATHLLPAAVRNVTDKLDVAHWTQPGWRNSTLDGRAHVQVLDWPGLAEGKTYRAQLIAFAEDA